MFGEVGEGLAVREARGDDPKRDVGDADPERACNDRFVARATAKRVVRPHARSAGMIRSGPGRAASASDKQSKPTANAFIACRGRGIARSAARRSRPNAIAPGGKLMSSVPTTPVKRRTQNQATKKTMKPATRPCARIVSHVM